MRIGQAILFFPGLRERTTEMFAMEENPDFERLAEVANQVRIPAPNLGFPDLARMMTLIVEACQQNDGESITRLLGETRKLLGVSKS